MAERAIYVERATMAGEVVTPLCQKQDDSAPYFSLILAPGGGAGRERARHDCRTWPGPAEWMTPEAAEAIEAASDVVGYGPYLERLALRADQRAPRQRQPR